MINRFKANGLNSTSEEGEKSGSMDHQRKNTKSGILDLRYSKDIAGEGNSVISTVNYEKHLRAEQELKNCQEPEMDIERDLEEEIKDGIYHLTLRLHRLCQHQKQGELTMSKELQTLSEVNINVKMEGGTKIEIKETTKREQAVLPLKLVRPRSSRPSKNLKSMQFNYERKEKV